MSEDSTQLHTDTLMRMTGPGSIMARRQYLTTLEEKEGFDARMKVERLLRYRWETRQAELQEIREKV